MRILVSNDDGINAEGIKELVNAMKQLGEVIVCAPAEHKSGAGHSITCTGSIKVEKVMYDETTAGFKVFGTPKDCVDLGCKALVDNIDLVITGINEGPNISSDVICSGTCGSASAALPYQIPAIAMSLAWGDHYDYSVAAKYAVKAAKWFLQQPFNKDFVLSVNVPNIPEDQIKGVTVCKFGGDTIYHQTEAPTFDGKYYYYSTKCDKITYNNYIDNLEGDVYALHHGYVTLTPLDVDVVKHDSLTTLKNAWNND